MSSSEHDANTPNRTKILVNARSEHVRPCVAGGSEDPAFLQIVAWCANVGFASNGAPLEHAEYDVVCSETRRCDPAWIPCRQRLSSIERGGARDSRKEENPGRWSLQNQFARKGSRHQTQKYETPQSLCSKPLASPIDVAAPSPLHCFPCIGKSTGYSYSTHAGGTKRHGFRGGCGPARQPWW